MEKRRLGNSDLHTAPIVFGGNVFGWTVDEKQSFKLLDAFFDLGFNAIDTADVYSRWVEGNEGGESETIIGKWMKDRGNRNQVLLITKVGSDMGQGKRDLSKSYILEAVDQSLERLQTDYIDLYLTHWDDEVTPVDETLEVYGKLIEAGKIRWAGASNLSPERLKASLEASKKDGSLPAYQVFQPEYNLCVRQGFEQGVAPVCKEYALGVITYYSLASGFLTGKYRSEEDLSKSPRGDKVKEYLDDRGQRILKALDELSKEYNTTPAALSLRWLMDRPGITAPIASATKVEHLKSFRAAVELNMTKEAMDKLDKASSW
ncbi:MAG: aldo/keto reductase [Deltaproteobacteria bacterium]|jgi:aryl-alcohol dehydrogenase-like predicted oxidoreductase